MKVKKLPSGWILIMLSQECIAQIPPGWTGDEIPDEYVFHPEWNRERINNWWKEEHEKFIFRPD